jgi:RimJ/RimL family protein N-acetyltransferase
MNAQPRLEPPIIRPKLVTRRLTLRPHRMADTNAWHALQRDDQIRRFMQWPLRDRAASYRHPRGRTHNTRLHRTNDFLALAIDLQGELIGDVSLRLGSVAPVGRNAEIACRLHPEFEHHGFAAEAASAMLELAFEHLGARWATALIQVDNHKPVALAERLRFTAVAVDDTSIACLATAATRAPKTVATYPRQGRGHAGCEGVARDACRAHILPTSA